MELRRIGDLPPYVFATVDGLKRRPRRAGRDVIDLGFGNPANHRYSASRGIPRLREAVAEFYARRFGATLDPETQVVTTIGAKEGLAHLM